MPEHSWLPPGMLSIAKLLKKKWMCYNKHVNKYKKLSMRHFFILNINF